MAARRDNMTDDDVIDFLRWALPEMGLRWAGFRKVRRQVRRKIVARIKELGVGDLDGYRQRLEDDPDEWEVLDAACRITISRFYRESEVFDALRDRVFPTLAKVAAAEERPVRMWSAGAASGEEPYTLSIMWQFQKRDDFASLPISIVATEINDHMIQRAHAARYQAATLGEMPRAWKSQAFDADRDEYVLRDALKEPIEFLQQDVRQEMPEGTFDLIACRYLVFTYFDEALQVKMTERLSSRLRRGGFLVLGVKESLPAAVKGYMTPFFGLPVYRKLK